MTVPVVTAPARAASPPPRGRRNRLWALLLVRARLATIGPQYEEAAMDLGASPLGAPRRIIVPLSADGVAAAPAPFGQSRMLPREAYVDPAVFEWEQRHIFSGRPYHSWSYRLDGSLRNAPHFSKVEGFQPDEFGLAEPVAGWEEGVAPYRPEDLVVVDRHSYELNTNWKVIAENYQECYHCSAIHPELSRISPPTSGENLHTEGSWMGGWMSIIEGAETMSLTGERRRDQRASPSTNCTP